MGDMLDRLRSRPLRRGQRNQNVAAWQRLLVAKGFVLTADGVFGTKTLSATKVAQEWAGLPGTGVIGPDTWLAVKVKRRTRRPVAAVRNIIRPAGMAPKVIDARDGKAGFARHRSRRWAKRDTAGLVKVGHYTGGPASFQADARFHVYSSYLSRSGAPAIAYHLGIDKDGTLFVFNQPDDLTWHCDGGRNQVTLGVVFRGATEGPTWAQRRTLRWVWAQLEAGSFRPVAGEPAWPRMARSTTHRHITSTSCPGERGEQFYRLISPQFRNSI